MSTTPEASRRALVRANQIRVARSELKRRIRTGELAAAAVITDPPEEALTWPVGGVLRAQHGWGAGDRRYGVRARDLLLRLSIRETKPVGLLTAHQRERIARALEGHDKQAGAW